MQCLTILNCYLNLNPLEGIWMRRGKIESDVDVISSRRGKRAVQKQDSNLGSIKMKILTF